MKCWTVAHSALGMLQGSDNFCRTAISLCTIYTSGKKYKNYTYI